MARSHAEGSSFSAEDWDADLAIVGLVKEPGEALSLWFVPRLAKAHSLAETSRTNWLKRLSGRISRRFPRRTHRGGAGGGSPARGNRNTRAGIGEGIEGRRRKARHPAQNPAAIERGERRARLQLSLGNALVTLGERERGTERLEQAVDAYRAALEEYTRERVPLDWAMTQNNLGVALQTLGERERGTERLEQAVSAYRAALEERVRERVPLRWAATQNNLGVALQTLGERERGTERLKQAVDAYHVALEERTRERVPLDWP